MKSPSESKVVVYSKLLTFPTSSSQATSGYGFVDLKLARQDFGDAVTMLKDLCRMLDGVAAWTGVWMRTT